MEKVLTSLNKLKTSELPSKQEFLESLGEFISAPPGIISADFGHGSGNDLAIKERRRVSNDKRLATDLLRKARRSTYHKEAVRLALSVYSRIEFHKNPCGGFVVHYSAGQYYPSEYRGYARSFLAEYLKISQRLELRSGSSVLTKHVIGL